MDRRVYHVIRFNGANFRKVVPGTRCDYSELLHSVTRSSVICTSEALRTMLARAALKGYDNRLYGMNARRNTYSKIAQNIRHCAQVSNGRKQRDQPRLSAYPSVAWFIRWDDWCI